MLQLLISSLGSLLNKDSPPHQIRQEKQRLAEYLKSNPSEIPVAMAGLEEWMSLEEINDFITIWVNDLTV